MPALNPSLLSLYYDIPGREKLQVNSQLEFPNYPLNTGIAGELSGVGSHRTPTDINKLCIIYLLHIMNTYLLIHTKLTVRIYFSTQAHIYRPRMHDHHTC